MSLWTGFKDMPFSQGQFCCNCSDLKTRYVEKLQINVGETLGIN